MSYKWKMSIHSNYQTPFKSNSKVIVLKLIQAIYQNQVETKRYIKKSRLLIIPQKSIKNHVTNLVG